MVFGLGRCSALLCSNSSDSSDSEGGQLAAALGR